MKTFLFTLMTISFCLSALAQDTFTPYQAGEVPNNVLDLWKDYDPRKEALETKIIKEWQEDGVVARYITFKVGTFKGQDARIAAYYCFPKNGQKNPAFVWSHGGGQRADKTRGIYFAKCGFASVDINWLGRPMEQDIDENTDWGKVDPSQGPRFYSKALRKGWKRGLEADEFSIDPIDSPRNNNWFLLVVAAKRALTFLEQQAEVDANKLGFSGFSMGGTITSMTAMDPRLKAVAPFVGGTGFLHEDFPGLSGTGLAAHYAKPGHLEMYVNTIDPSAYWPHVKIPVMFINSSNDFHAVFDRVYQTMDLLKHSNWRVSMNMHENHGPGAEQWITLNKWFNLYLKGEDERMPATALSSFDLTANEATFTVTPDNRKDDLLEVEIYYSHNPNSITRFWNRAQAERQGDSWQAKITHDNKIPIYTFALCRYKLDKEEETLNGNTSTYSIFSEEHSYVPKGFKIEDLKTLAKDQLIFEDFSHGIQGWTWRHGNLNTYKFQDPSFKFDHKKLSITIDPKQDDYYLQIGIDSRFLGAHRDIGRFHYSVPVPAGASKDIIIKTSDFKSHDKKPKTVQWSRISKFSLALINQKTKKKIDFSTAEGLGMIKVIKLID
ncbi:dienelactone hydrolase family protein [Lentisphaera marina]|uniref:alpha/beta hydrolase family protein n=1 Tax=Lentisphaera marina TaxID=1111041 RepID=UPI0023651C6A|nr:dienelactone hydrolase family protein [Lentisphaera marina]MDD7983990.1 dienelactone hydrolase family protein [Lentisphaera marina]